MQSTNEATIAYEAATECITHIMSIVSGELFGSEADTVSPERKDALKRKLASLAAQQQRLRVSDALQIAKIREQYGQFVRQFSISPLHPVDLDAIPQI